MKNTIPFDPASPYSIAYFSMEVGLMSEMPTYSGGLGVLAGDTLKAAADLEIPLVGVTLLHRKGYFLQHLDARGGQTESPSEWNPSDFLESVDNEVAIKLEGRTIHIKAWRYLIKGENGGSVPVYFMDTSSEKNSAWDQTLTDHLYGGDARYRFCQEAVLGLGGVALLRSLRYYNIRAFHMNEGHSALLTLAVLKEYMGQRDLTSASPEDIEKLRRRCVFTTHTPVPAGHDKFPMSLVKGILGKGMSDFLDSSPAAADKVLNMTLLALMYSGYINGVSHQHEKISQDMFPDYPINSITNGVHVATWVSPPFKKLFDQHMEEWRYDSLYLRYAINIPLEEIRAAHQSAKKDLIREVEKRTGVLLSEEVMIIGFARRATAYKRADLLFSNPDRLRGLAKSAGPLQIVFGGKAHPRDDSGKEMIKRIFHAAGLMKDDITLVYLEGYDMALAKPLCSGVDLWLNTPRKPHEASGTSGMKAALNGVPSLSVLDGWWIEGHVEGVTGWSIDEGSDGGEEAEIRSLYHKLENKILPMYYRAPETYASVMRSAIALNGSFFTTQRMLFQYLKNAYTANHGRQSD